MSTILLGSVGSVIGGLFGPIGALVGRAIGTLAGSMIDTAIINALTPPVRHEGPRLTTTDIQTSTEGTPINRVYGRARMAGQIIWATRFQEVVKTEKSGGKGGGGPKVVTTTYTYYGNFAVGLCEGPVSGIGRIWVDGEEIDQTGITFRVYRGTNSQNADPLIEAKEGSAPAYRGLCYIVFEQLDLSDYGNRIPQIAVEIYRAVGQLENLVNSVAVIAGNEYGFDTQFVQQVKGPTENRRNLVAATDWTASINRLRQLAPNCSSVMLVCPWFGDDLRAGGCTIRPKVDAGDKNMSMAWRVCGITRNQALVVSQVGGKPAYGGSPNDASVLRAIADLKARGFSVTLLPFMMMDIPSGNSLPNPYGGASQPAYPWRGRITCHPAPGQGGSPDKTSTAASQVAAFVGTAAPAHFSASGGQVVYSGPNEWSYRRFILHYARLAQMAGGVEAFLIGSEMIGLTQVRSSASAYPFVNALVSLAADVRSIVGAGVKISYAADWAEYNSHRPGDGSGDLYFNLDPLWSNSNIDFVGIDNYLPLSDWREGSGHADFDPNGPTMPYDQAYLRGNVEGGEYYDWYYADKAGRDAQNRLPIGDGAYGKPWVYRQKDIRGWWSNQHFNRPGGTQSGSATAWVPQSKPLRFVEVGCPAVDKGANQPNVFPDPKSGEGAYPYYSTRGRDDVMARAYLEAMLAHYGAPANNPMSSVYSGRMIDMSKATVWAWDARPWPTFPLDTYWGDRDNWEAGHWINGRLGLAPAQETIQRILADAGFGDAIVEPIPAVVDGVTIGGITSPRAILDALRPVYQFDAVESDGVIKFLARIGRAAAASVSLDDLVITDPTNPTRYRRTRAQETELPDSIILRYGDIARDDQPASVEARRVGGGSRRTIEYSVPVTLAENLARRICDTELHSAWVGRERAQFTLPPSRIALDAGDVIAFGGGGDLFRMAEIADSEFRRVDAFMVDPLAAAGAPALDNTTGAQPPVVDLVAAQMIFVDGPLLLDDDSDHAGYIGAFMNPYSTGVAAYRETAAGGGYELDSVLPLRATIGETTADFYSGPVARWDRVNELRVALAGGTLQSSSNAAVLNGSNVLMIENEAGEWEVLQFATAELDGPNSYILRGFLRGQKGSEHAMRDPVPTGARVMLFNEAIGQTGIGSGLVGLSLNWKIGPASKPLGAPEFGDMTMTLQGKGRRPLSPVHLKAAKQANDDFALSWIRRTRIGGDSWEVAEVPLGEEAERYDVEILNGAGTVILRTVTGLTSPAFTYTAAQQVADFGSAQSSVRWRVYQTSATFGRGIPGVYS